MKFAILTILLIGLSACSSKPKVKEFPDSADEADEMANLSSSMEDGRERNLSLLAPESYTEAKHSLKAARQLNSEGKSREKVLHEVAQGNAYMDQAEKNAKENYEKLSDVLMARDAAIAANAQKFYKEDFNKLDDEVKVETTKLEQDKKDNIKEKRAEFITGYRDLELKAVKTTYLGASKSLIDESVANGARQYAPKSLAATQSSYKDAETYITQNRHNVGDIEVVSASVLAKAQDLRDTTATAKNLKESNPEETALKMRADEDRLMKAEASSAALAASNSTLSEEQKLNAVYEEARKQFTPEEAEVYKQGKNLVIRLRSIEFPKGQAVLKGNNFGVLKKVEDVIKSFDSSLVVVEGHTDSTGGKEVNQKLSTERADAVKQYLEANADEMTAEFDSKGYGYEKPLASNKTASGRAQNRRVDVVITPSEI